MLDFIQMLKIILILIWYSVHIFNIPINTNVFVKSTVRWNTTTRWFSVYKKLLTALKY